MKAQTDRNLETYEKLLAQGLAPEEALLEMQAYLHPIRYAALEEGLKRANAKHELKDTQKPG